MLYVVHICVRSIFPILVQRYKPFVRVSDYNNRVVGVAAHGFMSHVNAEVRIRLHQSVHTSSSRFRNVNKCILHNISE